MWDGSIPERLADVPGCEAEQVDPWLWLEHEVKKHDLSLFPQNYWNRYGARQDEHR